MFAMITLTFFKDQNVKFIKFRIVLSAIIKLLISFCVAYQLHKMSQHFSTSFNEQGLKKRIYFYAEHWNDIKS